jgi:hypothetical protein
MTCQRCGARANVVPGEAYHERDVALFDKLEAVVHRAQLSEQDANVIAFMLNDLADRTQAPDIVISRLLGFLPELGFLTSRLPEVRSQLVRALGMLLPIIGTRFRRVAS